MRLIFMLLIFTFSLNIYGQDIYDYYNYIKENGEIKYLPYDLDVNNISEYYKYLIANNKIKKLYELMEEDEEKYNIIIQYLQENEDINKYYYEIIMVFDIKGKKIELSYPDYRKVNNLPDYKNIKNIIINIFYEDIFYKKYEEYLGDPTGKCFTIEIDSKNNIERYYWK